MSSSLFGHVRTRLDAAGLAWTGIPDAFSVPAVAEDDYLRRLGAVIQASRKALGWSQAELGDKVGRDANSISRWERGATSLSAYDLVRLWEVLGVDAEWLLSPTDSITELDRRVAHLRRLAVAAAKRDVEVEQARRAEGDKAPQRGKRT